MHQDDLDCSKLAVIGEIKNWQQKFVNIQVFTKNSFNIPQKRLIPSRPTPRSRIAKTNRRLISKDLFPILEHELISLWLQLHSTEILNPKPCSAFTLNSTSLSHSLHLTSKLIAEKTSTKLIIRYP